MCKLTNMAECAYFPIASSVFQIKLVRRVANSEIQVSLGCLCCHTLENLFLSGPPAFPQKFFYQLL